jgi:hypothetical protein
VEQGFVGPIMHRLCLPGTKRSCPFSLLKGFLVHIPSENIPHHLLEIAEVDPQRNGIPDPPTILDNAGPDVSGYRITCQVESCSEIGRPPPLRDGRPSWEILLGNFLDCSRRLHAFRFPVKIRQIKCSGMYGVFSAPPCYRSGGNRTKFYSRLVPCFVWCMRAVSKIVVLSTGPHGTIGSGEMDSPITWLR